MSNKIQMFLIVIGIILVSVFVHFKNNEISDQIANVQASRVLKSEKTLTQITFTTSNGTYVVRRSIDRKSHNAHYFEKSKIVWVVDDEVIVKTTFNNFRNFKIVRKI